MCVACCAGSGICDELIIRSEEFYYMCVCLNVCYLKTSRMRRPGPMWAVEREKEKILLNRTGNLIDYYCPTIGS